MNLDKRKLVSVALVMSFFGLVYIPREEWAGAKYTTFTKITTVTELVGIGGVIGEIEWKVFGIAIFAVLLVVLSAIIWPHKN